MLRLYVTLFALLISTPSMASDLLPAPRQVSDHAWAWIGPYGPPTRENGGFRMNLGFVVGESAVAVIDSGYGGAMAEAMLTHIRRITDQPVRHVINTNSQPHRIMGNPVFRRAGAEVIAAAGVIERFTAEGPAFTATVEDVLGLETGSVEPPRAPGWAIEAETVLDLGGVRLRLVPVGDAHTRGSLIAVVEPDGVVFAGDVLYGGRLLAILPESRVQGWILAFGQLQKFGKAQFVPGHGEPGTLSAFEHSTHEYLTAIKVHMDQAVEEGIDLQDAI
ncbi:MAG: MBL fold metallo-hydrolase, partial [Gammaproteobacteria bacterium]|nr:MBL fold metallo-hydrolase [Gammaproteobacteria bacterium]